MHEIETSTRDLYIATYGSVRGDLKIIKCLDKYCKWYLPSIVL